MGCVTSRRSPGSVVSGSIHLTHKPNPDEDSEIEEIAELPIRAQDEDFDLVSAVELSVSCNNLFAGKGVTVDPTAVFYIDDGIGNWVEKGRTEIQRNNLNPSFIKSFKISYSFEKQLRFRFDIYNINYSQDSKSLKWQTQIGSAKFNIHELVCSPSHSITRDLINSNVRTENGGTISVSSEEMSRLKHRIKMQWEFINQKIKGHLILKLSRITENNEVCIYQTEGLAKIPRVWEQFELTINRLCKGDERKPVTVGVYKIDKMLVHKFLGKSEFTLEELKTNGNFETTIRNNGKPIGILKLNRFIYQEVCTFLDYVFGGCEISLIIGIDFTKSNGVPTSPNSLHYFSTENPNEYVQAIKAVGDILQYYDSDKRIPAYGFGARLPPYFDIVSHCFALNKNIFDPEVTGIDGVLNVYKSTINSIIFHGPTIFHELIKTASDYASSVQVSQEAQQYFILLILTDGIINDVESTVDEIVSGSFLPFSIIIVGIGHEDFTVMEFLDADSNPLFSKKQNRGMERDIVQFVPFSQFKGMPHELAKEVLFEIPKQMIGYMKNKGIKPNPPSKTEVLDTIGSARGQNQINSQRMMLPSPKNPHPSSMLLKNMRNQFIEDVVRLGFDEDTVIDVVDEGIPCLNVNMAIELINEKQSTIGPIKSVLKSMIVKQPEMSRQQSDEKTWERETRRTEERDYL
ncbi:unnamed protein product [Blepharisma stoltei]|uniref:C2 domain-containing protein n=1 Tax=Blepharisma stoltei TaxID=1481888 RepID=A0AAU9KB31_9CILI|nr:unnamed protein product [Blepharisma stoltei]